MYRELELEKLYKEYEEKTHAEIKALIAKVEDVPHAVSEPTGTGVFYLQERFVANLACALMLVDEGFECRSRRGIACLERSSTIGCFVP